MAPIGFKGLSKRSSAGSVARSYGSDAASQAAEYWHQIEKHPPLHSHSDKA